MKKTLALILAVVMCVGMASAAFAIDVTTSIDQFLAYRSDGTQLDITEGAIAYVAGDTFYVVPLVNGETFEITKAEVTQGSTTVYSPAYYYDDDGNLPLDAWVVQMKTQDIAAVKDYTTKLVVEGKLEDGTKVKGEVVLTVKDYDMIDENDINSARINDEDVDTLGSDGNYRYVVSADAFKAIKSGETFLFPYDGYSLTVGSGIKNALNFRASTEKIDNLVEKYGEDKILGFLDFKDKNDLAVDITVEMECTEYSSTHTTNQAYVYRIEGDDLVLITSNATYDSARDVVTFKTNKLGSLIISSEALTSSSSGTATTTTTSSASKENPGTGSNDVVALAVAGAAVAAAAGLVALKK